MSSNDLIPGRDTALARNAIYSADGGRVVARRVYTLSVGVNRIPTLRALLDDCDVRYRPKGAAEPAAAVLAWGKRPSAGRAQRYARRKGLAVWHIEDGFLRSIALGSDEPPLSIVVDDLGLYLDAGAPSRLEALIRQPLTGDQAQRARSLIEAWREGRVSKYNHSSDLQGALPDDCVLVVDQTRGDASIACGSANAASFTRMLEAALREHPHSVVLVKIHPDVVSGRKQGHYDLAQLAAMPRVQVLDRDVHPASLLGAVRAVYTVTSQLGFEALLWDVPVRVFGMPFYAGWGLTHDELEAPPRRCSVSLDQLTHAALVDYCRYVNPETGRRCEVETVVAWMAMQRRMRGRFGETVDAVGFSGWKRRYVREFFAGSAVRFRRGVRRNEQSGRTVATWGCKRDAHLASASPSSRVVRVEDGFLRSVGLGADLTRPLSWVLDDIGIYYDASRPSRLEKLLCDTEFTAELVARAALLRHAICAADITKYNLAGTINWSRPKGRHVILVPGQVETDASIMYGATTVQGNMALLQAVRQANPDAYVVYKPHPDVVAKLRKAGQNERHAQLWCDEVLGPVPFGQLLGRVDEVHVMTSLGGFEALLRRVPVVTYGQPFYAGWGLTRDLMLAESLRQRRWRKLELDELVAATLILYPTYISRATRRYTTPEQVLKELIDWRAMPEVPRWRHWLARLFREK